MAVRYECRLGLEDLYVTEVEERVEKPFTMSGILLQIRVFTQTTRDKAGSIGNMGRRKETKILTLTS